MTKLCEMDISEIVLKNTLLLYPKNVDELIDETRLTLSAQGNQPTNHVAAEVIKDIESQEKKDHTDATDLRLEDSVGLRIKSLIAFYNN
jgi:hypothetical protein